MDEMGFDDLLDKIRKEKKNNTDLGEKFERLVVNFFRKDTTYRNRFSKIWQFKDWPGRNRQDTGIDIVAQESENDEYVGIQCKCYDDDTPLDYAGIAKFLIACKSYKIKRFIYVCTSDKITPESERTIRENHIQLLNKSGLRSSSIQNWSEHFDKISTKEPKSLRDDQIKVRDDVIHGFNTPLDKPIDGLSNPPDRGRMLMACGTGKTLTSLRITEKLKCKTVLYLVPSISLIQQTMREWSDNSLGKYQYIAVCSDKSAGRDEGGQIYELERPPSTDPVSFAEQFSRRNEYDMTVIFSTYQSLDIVADALKSKGYILDLILCDEAHKTATKMFGVKKTGGDATETGQFAKVHDNNIVNSKRRLYMTATPKIYEGKSDDVFSMDNLTIYGPEFSTISFYDAVHGDNPVLSDFKVKIAILPEDRLPEYLGIIDAIHDPNATDDEKNRAKILEHKAKYAAAWHGILKPDDDPLMNKPLQKIIVFTNTIERSKMFAGDIEKKEHMSFKSIAEDFNRHYGLPQSATVRHIDGKMLSYQRRIDLDWLDDSSKDMTETRLISNAKCLSEGVDVPTLDGVIFMEPKKSTVDVVQSVGRVMRQAKGKDYGYVILPVVVPGGTTPDKILDNSRFNHVWQVLNALRSHDPRLIAELSSAGLVSKPDAREGIGTPRITIDFLGVDPEKEKKLYADITLAMRSKLVKKVGTVDYIQKYGAKIGAYAIKIEEIINKKYDEEISVKKKINTFHKEMQDLININVTKEDSIKMISQHVILKHVFDSLFYDDFASHNPVSKKLDVMLKSMGIGYDLAELGDFYEDVRRETDVIKNAPKNEIHERRQKFIKRIYASFISSAEKKTAIEKGIVYTPIEIADFIIHSIQYILKEKMGKTLGDQNVQILEPFVGTGTFLTRLIDSGMIDRTLEKKYGEGMHSNEIVLLAYYIAAVNMETTYAKRMDKLGKKSEYSPFSNINYVDTLKQNPEARLTGSAGLVKYMGDEYVDELMSRISRQNRQCIEVIIGNPPWGVAPKTKHISETSTHTHTHTHTHTQVRCPIAH